MRVRVAPCPPSSADRDVAQSAERHALNVKDAGSTPAVPATVKARRREELHRFPTPGIRGFESRRAFQPPRLPIVAVLGMLAFTACLSSRNYASSILVTATTSGKWARG